VLELGEREALQDEECRKEANHAATNVAKARFASISLHQREHRRQ
jgi:hypothetical protein